MSVFSVNFQCWLNGKVSFIFLPLYRNLACHFVSRVSPLLIGIFQEKKIRYGNFYLYLGIYLLNHLFQ
jgi:hypothetical protein